MKKLLPIIIMLLFSNYGFSQLSMLGKPKTEVVKWLKTNQEIFTLVTEGKLTSGNGSYFYTFKLNVGADPLRFRINKKDICDIFTVFTNRSDMVVIQSELNKKFISSKEGEWRSKDHRILITAEINEDGLYEINYMDLTA